MMSSATLLYSPLTHWGRVTHICVNKLTIIGSDNGLSPGRRQAIIWTNAGILLIGPLGTNYGEIAITIHIFSFKKMHLKMSSGEWRPFCLGLNVLKKTKKKWDSIELQNLKNELRFFLFINYQFTCIIFHYKQSFYEPIYHTDICAPGISDRILKMAKPYKHNARICVRNVIAILH